MNFRIKSFVQRIIACLPAPLANDAYYFIQRRWGRLQQVDPMPYFRQALLLIKLSRECWPSSGPIVLEVGTGRTVNIPFALWLAGATRIITLDLNRYLRPELVMESLSAFRRDHTELAALFTENDIPILQERWTALLSCTTADEALSIAQIEYHAPADAAHTIFYAQSIDLHISVNVLEHVPPNVLRNIMIEARRLLRPNGRMVHTVDPSDHFSQTDPSLNSVNFLRYSQSEWSKIAGNQFMYQNRLRVSDYQRTLEQSGFCIESKSTALDSKALKAILSGFPIHADFSHLTPEDLATAKLDFIARLA